MRKFEGLGKVLSKAEQKKIKGGDFEGTGCTLAGTACTFQSPGGSEWGFCDGHCWCIAQGVYHRGAECTAGGGPV